MCRTSRMLRVTRKVVLMLYLKIFSYIVQRAVGENDALNLPKGVQLHPLTPLNLPLRWIRPTLLPLTMAMNLNLMKGSHLVQSAELSTHHTQSPQHTSHTLTTAHITHSHHSTRHTHSPQHTSHTVPTAHVTHTHHSTHHTHSPSQVKLLLIVVLLHSQTDIPLYF